MTPIRVLVVDDHAVVTVGYADQAIGVIEAGFVASSGFQIEVFGTEGTLRYSDLDKRLVATGAGYGEGSVELDIPPNASNAFSQWVDHIHSDTRADDNIARAVELTRLVVAANAAAAEQHAVRPA